jgi:hypothetical protein
LIFQKIINLFISINLEMAAETLAGCPQGSEISVMGLLERARTIIDKEITGFNIDEWIRERFENYETLALRL